jgi:hypothetical protein
MILDVWETGEYKRWFRRNPAPSIQQAKPKRELVKSR